MRRCSRSVWHLPVSPDGRRRETACRRARVRDHRDHRPRTHRGKPPPPLHAAPPSCYCFPEACTLSSAQKTQSAEWINNRMKNTPFLSFQITPPPSTCPNSRIQGQVSINTGKFSYCPHNLVPASRVSFILKIKGQYTLSQSLSCL